MPDELDTRRFGAYPVDDLTKYPVDADKVTQLLEEQIECAITWTTQQGWPMAIVHWYVWKEERFWLTATANRKRVHALRDRPETCVLISSMGTSVDPVVMVAWKCVTTIHRAADRPDLEEWLYPALAERGHRGDPARAHGFVEMARNSDRVILELEPVRVISFDRTKLYDEVGYS
jgi:hypothetical protein